MRIYAIDNHYKVTVSGNTAKLTSAAGHSLEYKIISVIQDNTKAGDILSLEGKPYRITGYKGLDIFNRSLRRQYKVEPVNHNGDISEVGIYAGELDPKFYKEPGRLISY